MKINSKYQIKQLIVGQMATNCYLLENVHTRECIVIDPGDDGGYITGKITEYNIQPVAIIVTHGHFDHILAAGEIQATYNIPFYLHANDQFLISRMRESAVYFLGHPVVCIDPKVSVVSKCSSFSVGSLQFMLIHTPGHTPGSVSIVIPDIGIIVGDVLFAGGGIGRTDFSYSDSKQLHQSIDQILQHSGHVVLYPGHGDSTTVEQEKGYHNV